MEVPKKKNVETFPAKKGDSVTRTAWTSSKYSQGDEQLGGWILRIWVGNLWTQGPWVLSENYENFGTFQNHRFGDIY